MNTDNAWELWGELDPYFGVLTDPKFRSAALTPDAKDEFFLSGKHHVRHVIETCRRHVDPEFAPKRVLDFGCGVGRLVVAFAEHAPDVLGMDISSAMLFEARRNCDERGAKKASLVMSDDSLSKASGTFDLVHSCIVLQHIEVARGRELFSQLVKKVRSGGCGVIHVTFGWDAYAENFGSPPSPVPIPPPNAFYQVKALAKRALHSWGIWPRKAVVAELPEVANDPEMQMNYYNLSELFFILQRSGVERLFTEITDHGGAFGAVLYFKRSKK